MIVYLLSLPNFLYSLTHVRPPGVRLYISKYMEDKPDDERGSWLTPSIGHRFAVRRLYYYLLQNSQTELTSDTVFFANAQTFRVHVVVTLSLWSFEPTNRK